ncbi:hypothetical protein DPMN_008550 [Dreissena polymorpha]|uniref:Uncharacterized protein n=1 Tax=Dreissena polymorpha TaxID=45954 RepID=A0A9D4RZS5_DREPO|nr:hypothetical protein DPMN_008550 [Dreissena polymorpha]
MVFTKAIRVLSDSCRRTSLMTYRRTSLMTYRRTSLMTYRRTREPPEQGAKAESLMFHDMPQILIHKDPSLYYSLCLALQTMAGDPEVALKEQEKSGYKSKQGSQSQTTVNGRRRPEQRSPALPSTVSLGPPPTPLTEINLYHS